MLSMTQNAAVTFAAGLRPDQMLEQTLAGFTEGRTLRWHVSAIAVLTALTPKQLILTPAAASKLLDTSPSLALVRHRLGYTARARVPEWEPNPIRVSPHEVREAFETMAETLMPNASLTPALRDIVRDACAMLGGGTHRRQVKRAMAMIGNAHCAEDRLLRALADLSARVAAVETAGHARLSGPELDEAPSPPPSRLHSSLRVRNHLSGLNGHYPTRPNGRANGNAS